MLNVSCNSHCFLALCCALHRITSRVIHRTELYFFSVYNFTLIYNDKQQWFVEWKGMYKNNKQQMQSIQKINENESKCSFVLLVFNIMVRHNRCWFVVLAYKKYTITNNDCANLKCLMTKNVKNGNDPYAGSPTNTLLRLLLPLNDPVWASFRYKPNDPKAARKTKPKISLKHSIGSSDGRCVQRTGT